MGNIAAFSKHQGLSKIIGDFASFFSQRAVEPAARLVWAKIRFTCYSSNAGGVGTAYAIVTNNYCVPKHGDVRLTIHNI